MVDVRMLGWYIRAVEKINYPNLLVSESVFCVALIGEYSSTD
jgi:hypothetical protein